MQLYDLNKIKREKLYEEITEKFNKKFNKEVDTLVIKTCMENYFTFIKDKIENRQDVNIPYIATLRYSRRAEEVHLLNLQAKADGWSEEKRQKGIEEIKFKFKKRKAKRVVNFNTKIIINKNS